MALIKCPNCGKEISDQAKKCTQCGYDLSQKPPTILLCPECHRPISKVDRYCENCGYPLSNSEKPAISNEAPVIKEQNVKSNESQKKRPSKKIIWSAITAVLVIAVVCVGFYAVRQSNQKKNEAAYISDLNDVVDLMATGVILAEDTGSLIYDVWYNTIFEENDPTTDKFTKKSGRFNDDFNDSLELLFMDADFIESRNSLKDNKAAVITEMKSLQNPPEIYSQAYSDLKELYDCYLDLVNQILDPTGNLNTYRDNFNHSDQEFIDKYDSIYLYFD